MALITTNMVKQLWRRLYRKGQGKEDIKTGRLPDPLQIRAIFQAIEDRWDGDKINYKAAMDAAAGYTLTGNQAKILGMVWLQAKAERGNV